MLRLVAWLTQAQADLLKWVVESGSGEVLLVPVGNASEDIAIIPDGPRQSVNPTDFRELVAQGLLRHVKNQLHELTNEGRLTYAELMGPPPSERPPVGFRPT
jgi:hypothetical protein